MRLMDKMRDGIRHFLRIQDAPKQTLGNYLIMMETV